MKSQLLATFTTKNNLDETIERITGAYVIVFNKVYVLQNENNVNELICTYNVDSFLLITFFLNLNFFYFKYPCIDFIQSI